MSAYWGGAHNETSPRTEAGAALKISNSERFWSKVNRSGPDGCWEWQACLGSGGYGKFPHKSVMILAHRYAYVEARGAIPAGLELDHLCRNRKCVNPDHLEPVTHRVNGDRGFSVPAMNARKTHCKRGHAFDEINTYLARITHLSPVCSFKETAVTT